MSTFACVLIFITLLKLLKNIVSIILLLVFILSTSGITILTHYCSGSKKTTQHILSEITGNREGCGGMLCSSSLKTISVRETLSKSSCCKENSSFYKIAVVDNPHTNQISVKILVGNLIISDLHLPSRSVFALKDFPFPLFHSIPPPLAGKQLAVFLQQLRIPSLFCIS
jgi:hypothetical protein